MHLPVNPPVAPMLAKPVKQIPDGPYSFEPKWDGFRSVIFRDGDEVEIGSRNERPLTRYFPELVAAVRASLPTRCVIDGEIVIPDAGGRCLDFEALLQRIHPADSRVGCSLSRRRPTSWPSTCSRWVTMTAPSAVRGRRAVLDRALATRGTAGLPDARRPTGTPLATEWFRQFEGAGLDGWSPSP